MTYSLHPLPLANLRDLGGTQVTEGRIRSGALWRSDDPTIGPPAQMQELAHQGVSLVVDLRSTSELSASPHRAAAGLGVRHHHLPLAEAAVHPLAMIKAAPTVTSAADVGRWYAGLVRSHVHEVVNGLQLIGATEGGVLLHCAAGKDRTGILAAVVLTLLGAQRSLIVEDYAATQQNLAAILHRLRGAAYIRDSRSHPDDPQTQQMAAFFTSGHPLLGATGESMHAMLTDLGGEDGVKDLVSRHVRPEELVDQLRTALVE